MNWLLVVVIIILLGSALRGYQNGFVKTAFSLVSILIIIVLTSVVSPILSSALRNNETVMGKIDEKLEKVIELEESFDNESEEASFIENLTLPENMKKVLIQNNNAKAYKAMKVDSFKDYLINALAVIVINVISYVVCFIVAAIVLTILCHVLDLISKLPLLNEVNKTVGLLLGFFSGCIKIWIFFVLITLFSTTSLSANVFRMINDSPLLTWIYSNNLLMKGIMNLAHCIF